MSLMSFFRARSSMDRASASEAGNVGSTPAGRIYKVSYFARRADKLLCLRREAKVTVMFLFEATGRKAKTARPGP